MAFLEPKGMLAITRVLFSKRSFECSKQYTKELAEFPKTFPSLQTTSYIPGGAEYRASCNFTIL